jgi:adenylosuccinate lyase
VQRAAAAAWDEGASFHDEIAKDPEVIARLDAAAVDVLFDPRRFLVNLGPVFDRLEALEVAR